MDFSDVDKCALRSLRRDLPAVAYPEKDSLLHYILQTLGWKEEHNIEASLPDGPCVQFIKMSNPHRE